jgi:hypothetical protein
MIGNHIEQVSVADVSDRSRLQKPRHRRLLGIDTYQVIHTD